MHERHQIDGRLTEGVAEVERVERLELSRVIEDTRELDDDVEARLVAEAVRHLFAGESRGSVLHRRVAQPVPGAVRGQHGVALAAQRIGERQSVAALPAQAVLEDDHRQIRVVPTREKEGERDVAHPVHLEAPVRTTAESPVNRRVVGEEPRRLERAVDHEAQRVVLDPALDVEARHVHHRRPQDGVEGGAFRVRDVDARRGRGGFPDHRAGVAEVVRDGLHPEVGERRDAVAWDPLVPEADQEIVVVVPCLPEERVVGARHRVTHLGEHGCRRNRQSVIADDGVGDDHRVAPRRAQGMAVGGAYGELRRPGVPVHLHGHPSVGRGRSRIDVQHEDRRLFEERHLRRGGQARGVEGSVEVEEDRGHRAEAVEVRETFPERRVIRGVGVLTGKRTDGHPAVLVQVEIVGEGDRTEGHGVGGEVEDRPDPDGASVSAVRRGRRVVAAGGEDDGEADGRKNRAERGERHEIEVKKR